MSGSGSYKVYAWWRKQTAQPQNVPYTTYHDAGSSTVTVNQKLTGDKWTLLGSYNLSPGANERVTVTDAATANLYVQADAVALADAAATPWKATWTPTLPRRDEYQVYARWPAAAANASDAPYTIYHEGGSATVTKNQQATGNSWQLLGTFVMAPGQNHRVELADTANGNLIADAVKFVPKAAPKTATWSFTVGTTGSYKLYAKWPASSAHATDAQFTVTHAGGTGTVSANERSNGGQWNLLGTYTFNSGSSYKVDLSDQASAGKLVADAIYIVGTTPPTATFTWTPTFPSAGAYQVYARWPASSGNTSAAQYTVTRDGGTSTVTLNQKQNGGSWVPLGSYNFTPGAGQKVTLAASPEPAPGLDPGATTIADAMLFVGAGAQPANLLYVHPDHLGSPQKMTDASQATVWDGVFDPFGGELSIAGLAANPLRFPGQYADAETGFSYNVSRDYEPSLGRYMQSDPIGLHGGANTYAYANLSPTRWIDTNGQATVDSSCCGAVPDLDEQVKSACKQAATKIRDPLARACAQHWCEHATIACDGFSCSWQRLLDSKIIAWADERDPGEESGSIRLCPSYTNAVNSGHWGCVVIHETSHLCGWKHENGAELPPSAGVPGWGSGGEYDPGECSSFLGQ